MHTTPNATVPTPDLHTQLRKAKAEAALVIRRVETEALIDEPEPTGDPNQDAIIARERNRRRLAATQALTHIRAVQHEQRADAKARALKPNPKDESTESPSASSVPPAACRPVRGLQTPSNPPEPAPPAPGLTTLDLQESWLRERKQAMSQARAKQKSRKGRKR